jgi:hypothetical protein
MYYKNIKDLNALLLQNLSIIHCGYRAKVYISKSAVCCLETTYNQVATATRISEQPSLYEVNIKMFLDSEFFEHTLKKDKHSLFTHKHELKCRNKIVKRNQA